jgi:hypothetical protein
MTQSDKDTFLLDIQGKFGIYGGKLASALSIGNCSDTMIKNSIEANYLFDVLRRFKADVDDEDNCLTEEDFCCIRKRILTLIS